MAGKKSKGYDENKPLLQMSELERERAWEDLGADTHRAIMAEARAESTMQVTVAALVLVRADGSEIVISWNTEYGDDEGTRSLYELQRSLRRQKCLQPGESMRLCHALVDLSKLRLTPVLGLEDVA